MVPIAVLVFSSIYFSVLRLNTKRAVQPKRQTLHHAAARVYSTPDLYVKKSIQINDIRAKVASNHITKTRFSNNTRFIFVAGLEGTGHHFLGNILQGSHIFRVSSADPIRCNLMRLDSSRGLFDLNMDSDAYHQQEQKTIKLFRTLSSNSTSFTLRVLNTHIDANENCYTGMMSYPNGISGTSWPDLGSLAEMAERAGIDLRIIVLTRPSIPMIRSISSRVRNVQKNSHLAEIGAIKLSKQLSSIDASFYSCVSYDDLTSVTRDAIQKLQNFLVPEQHAVNYDLISEVQKHLQHKHSTFDSLNLSMISRADYANQKLIEQCRILASS